MRTAIIGAGAMGSLFGTYLSEGGEDVTLIDIWQEAVDAINTRGLVVEDQAGVRRVVPIRATSDPTTVGVVDLVLVFVKCYHTETAVRGAASLMGPQSVVLTLQNGWGNAPRIAAVVGKERVLAGVTYHSATVLGPGQIQHAGRGMTFIGELNGSMSERLNRLAETFRVAGIDVTPTDSVLKAIWSKLALNVCTLPTSALLRFTAGQLVEHEGTLKLMRGLLRETVAVANAKGIALDEEERWSAITGLLERAQGAKASMLQDVEKGRRTEIDVVNGAIVAAGRERNIPTPHNETMVWLIQSLEATFGRPTADRGETR